MAMASAMGGVYAIPLIAFQTSGVFTNTTPVDAYRGAGKPEANYLIERCIDIAADQLGMDALKLRRKNIFRRFPIPARWGLRSSRAALRTRSITRSRPPRDSMRAARSSRKRGRLRGLGYACFLEDVAWPAQ
jgi:carbon-monoxide dehydrogenase large subunit